MVNTIKAVLLCIVTPILAAKLCDECPGGLYGFVGNLLVNYPPAQAYCTSNYPIPAKTTTLSYSTVVTTTYSTKTVTRTKWTVTDT